MLIRRVHGCQLRYLSLYREQFADRVRSGRVVDGHGDLRPEHIYLTKPPNIIDCVEFSDEFRTIDVIDELSFLSMECEELGADWVGEEVLAKYLQDSGDKSTPALEAFFKAYRACVRAKVIALRAKQANSASSASLLKLADEYLRIADRHRLALGRPVLVVVRGLSGTGKSTFATLLANTWGAQLIQTDLVRKQLFGSSSGQEAYGAGRYSLCNRNRVYDEMFAQADQELNHGQSVVLDGTFLTRALRIEAIDVARRHGAEVLLVECRCPPEIALERVKSRAAAGETASEIRPELVRLQQEQQEDDDAEWPVCIVDTSSELTTLPPVIVSDLRDRLGLSHNHRETAESRERRARESDQ